MALRLLDLVEWTIQTGYKTWEVTPGIKVVTSNVIV